MPFPTYKSKADIPKGAEDVYEEKDGGWSPILPDTSKADETITKLRKEKKDAETASKTATDNAADLQRQLDAAKASGGDVDKKIAELLEKWNKDTDAKVATVQKQLDEATGSLRTKNLDDKLREYFVKAGGRPERADKAVADTKKHFDLVDDKIVHKNEKGDVTTTKPEDFYAKTYREEMKEWYTGTKAAGGSSTGGAGTKPVNTDPAAAERVIKDPLGMLKEANAAAASA
jgi:hypothetical protein